MCVDVFVEVIRAVGEVAKFAKAFDGGNIDSEHVVGELADFATRRQGTSGIAVKAVDGCAFFGARVGNGRAVGVVKTVVEIGNALQANECEIALLWVEECWALCSRASVWCRTKHKWQEAIATRQIVLLKVLKCDREHGRVADHTAELDVAGILIVARSRLST